MPGLARAVSNGDELVSAGEGFTENMKAFLVSTGKAVEYSEVEPWLRLFFGLKLK